MKDHDLIVGLLIAERNNVTKAYLAERTRHIDRLNESGSGYTMFDQYLASLETKYNKDCAKYNKKITKLLDKMARL